MRQDKFFRKIGQNWVLSVIAIIVVFLLIILVNQRIMTLVEVLTLIISLMFLIVAVLTFRGMMELFRYTKLHDIPILTIDIVSGKTVKTKLGEIILNLKLVLKNIGQKGLKGKLDIYFCGIKDNKQIFEDPQEFLKFKKKFERVESIKIHLQPNRTHGFCNYNFTFRSKEKIGKKLKKGYDYSNKSHQVILEGYYKSDIEENSEKIPFCKTFRLLDWEREVEEKLYGGWNIFNSDILVIKEPNSDDC